MLTPPCPSAYVLAGPHSTVAICLLYTVRGYIQNTYIYAEVYKTFKFPEIKHGSQEISSDNRYLLQWHLSHCYHISAQEELELYKTLGVA